MLLLTRKLGERVYIGDTICITVTDARGGRVQLGVEAPRDVPVYRDAPHPGPPAAPAGDDPDPEAD